METVTSVLLGVLLGVVVLMLVSPFFKGNLMNHPANSGKMALFTEVEPGRVKVKMRGGRFVGKLYGDKKPEWSINVPWYLFELYVYWLFGLRVIGIPYIQKIHTYKLPHYRAIESNGKKELVAISDRNDESFFSDHLRYELTTWYFMFSGAEVETIPITVKGSVQIRIRKGMEEQALFGTDSWNVLLDQALNSVLRSTIRSDLTLDLILGQTLKDIWASPSTQPSSTYDTIRVLVERRLKEYTIENSLDNGTMTLLEASGVDIDRVDIIDFAPDLDAAEAKQLYSAALARQVSRARSIAGQGEAEFQEKLLATLAKHPELAKDNVWAESFVKASRAGSLDSLVAAFVKKILT